MKVIVGIVGCGVVGTGVVELLPVANLINSMSKSYAPVLSFLDHSSGNISSYTLTYLRILWPQHDLSKVDRHIY